jgi:uncharacterized protein (TIGR02266 family)
MTTPPRSPRFAVRFQVVYDDGENFMSGPVIDVSETGMFVETVMPPEPGQALRITPLLPEHAGLFELEGVVVRKNEYDAEQTFEGKPGMGVRFTNITPEARAQLRKLFNGKRA